ncbi:MAG: hypothetical protein M1820_009718 [Bogoriella megaspora]|nr:MAG: hypothetical protein M1820_009718 [Bogoriella megaspora]
MTHRKKLEPLPLHDARVFYADRRYKDVLRELKEASDRDSLNMSLLDLRAKTYVQLGELRKARDDAFKMIKLDYKDAKGYIRAIEVLCKMDDKPRALKIAQLGLKRVSNRTNGLFMILNNMHSQLAQKFAPLVFRDPIKVLPLELVRNILEMLPFRQMVICMRVSQSWHNTIKGDRNLWKHLDLSEAHQSRRPLVRYAFVKKAIKITDGGIKHVTLQGIDKNENLVVKDLTTKCNLLSLKVLSAFDVRTILAGGILSSRTLTTLEFGGNIDIYLDTVQVILKNIPSIERMTVGCFTTNNSRINWPSHLSNLKLLELKAGRRCGGATGALFLPGLFAVASNLEILALNNWTTLADFRLSFLPLTKLLSLDLAASDFTVDLCQVPSSVCKLRASGFIENLSDPEDQWGALLPNLTELECRCVASARRMLQDTDSKTQRKELRRLSLDHSCVDKSDVCLEVLSSRRLGPELEELALVNYRAIEDKFIQQIVNRFPNLRYVDVSFSKITGVGVKTMVLGLELLERLVVVACPVSSDAIEWARGRGIHVKVAPAWMEKSGKKVRGLHT